MTWNLPNILTIGRLLAAPFLAFAFVFLPRGLADWVAIVLFVGAALTDYIDGYLARKWKQESKFGAMLDPIADKAMVVIALMILVGAWDMYPYVVFPAALIMFREVFVSGLREFLGADAGKLQVTKLAKWKTTAQMVAISLLFAQGVFEHHFWANTVGMDDGIVSSVLSGNTEDEMGLWFLRTGALATHYAGLWVLWIAAALTLITGWDYFNKSRPYLVDEPDA
ncbi:CDP-diacylglycerol--glycerol-3-phosphate 3-phosphatidyltransferase [Falsihalocynthiibacter sp. SS001]|uniref:CDP-diacylglycerol--glycerol-3-phosphate 3-phosphatidyltransferase n=1 Tax=Falsihalocynthiibacter sp. SS001 TaxID=3349698 RepID=UPI0036D38480